MECVQVSTNYSSNTSYNDTFDSEWRENYNWYKNVEYIIDRYVTHYICLFGIIGNFINLLVLTRKSLTAHMARMEKSSHGGLIALAVSDFLFCLCSFPQAYQDDRFGRPAIDFWLVYDTYAFACINCFLITSTWLTVAMAVCRYLAICHPIRARQYLGMTAARAIIVAIFCLAILFNLPRFWVRKIVCEVRDGNITYFKTPDFFYTNAIASAIYMWIYFIFGILLPLLVLAFCNIFLMKALRQSHHLRRQHSVAQSQQSNDATRIVTLTLCVIVIMYIVLVGPAELITFWRRFVVTDNVFQYALAVRICNCMQMLNFAVNFILYCIINVHFRKVVKDLLLCYMIREQISSRSQSRIEQSSGNGQEAMAMIKSQE